MTKLMRNLLVRGKCFYRRLPCCVLRIRSHSKAPDCSCKLSHAPTTSMSGGRGGFDAIDLDELYGTGETGAETPQTADVGRTPSVQPALDGTPGATGTKLGVSELAPGAQLKKQPRSISRPPAEEPLLKKVKPDIEGSVRFVDPAEVLADLKVFEDAAVLVDKPLMLTSYDVVHKIKIALKSLDRKLKVGHAGTLDPLASGLMLICTGKATKRIDSFITANKVYTGAIRLGEATTTYDAEGEVTETLPWETITDDQIHDAASKFLGTTMQVAPVYSALKINGKPSYQLARAGNAVEKPARPVTLTEYKVWREDPSGPLVRFKIACSKGTYIRSLAHDLGKALGTCAHVAELRRESVGDYTVDDAWELGALVDKIWACRRAAKAEQQKQGSHTVSQ